MKKFISFIVIIFLITPNAKSQSYKPRNRYIQGSSSLLKARYNNQTYKSDYAISLDAGRTFFLHKQALNNEFWIGFDWTILDLALARFEKNVEAGMLEFKQLEAGMHFGPSFWYSPVNGLNFNYYLHFAPTLSRIKFKGLNTKINDYAQYWVTGASFSYKLFSLGLEYRWGSYNESNVKTKGPGFYFGIRLW